MQNFESKEFEPRESKLEFVQIDPRKSLEEQTYDFGIEVTMPGAKNDLDHHGSEATAETPSASEQSLKLKEENLPKSDAKIAILRADGDSMTAAAIIKSRQEGREIDEELVKAIGILDRKGPKEAEKEFVDLRDQTTAIMARAADFKLPLDVRIEFIQKILERNPAIKEEIDKIVGIRNQEFEKAKQESKVEVTKDGKIATVVSKHRFAMNLGYEKANIVVATNPEMAVMEKNTEGKMLPTGETYIKHTLARLNQFVPVDINACMKELNELEKEKDGQPLWGGRGDIVGSPQNESSKLTTHEVLEVVKKYVQ